MYKFFNLFVIENEISIENPIINPPPLLLHTHIFPPVPVQDLDFNQTNMVLLHFIAWGV